MNLDGAALVVHLFVDAGTQPADGELDYLEQIWKRLRTEPPDVPQDETAPELGLSVRIADLPIEPSLTDGTGLLAGIRRPGATAPHVEEALLRREHDTFCLSLMREPAGATWASLEQDWLRVTRGLKAPSGLIGVALVFQAGLPRPGLLARLRSRGRPDPAALVGPVRDLLPDPGTESGSEAAPHRWSSGVVVSHGYVVWEASDAADERATRRIVVVTPDDRRDWLSGWTWVVGPDRHLPDLGRYLKHAAQLRYQLRVWRTERPAVRAARASAEATVDELLGLLDTGRSTSARLLDAARHITALQADERGLVRTHTALVAMRCTVDIATANLTAESDPDAGGLFADDRRDQSGCSEGTSRVTVRCAHPRSGQLRSVLPVQGGGRCLVVGSDPRGYAAD